MDYFKLYQSITDKARTNKIGITEKHHILPKCMNGTDDKENLIVLTLREHFICHYLLCKIYPENKKLLYAFNIMSNRYKSNSRIYQSLKESFYLYLSVEKKEWYKNNPHPKGMLGKKHSQETKDKIGNFSRGKQFNEETKNKLSELYHNKTEEEKKKINEKISKSKMGQKHSQETKDKISTIAKERYKGGYENPTKGKHIEEYLSKEQVIRIKKSLSEKASKRFKGKTYEELYGPKKAQELKEKRRLSAMKK